MFQDKGVDKIIQEYMFQDKGVDKIIQGYMFQDCESGTAILKGQLKLTLKS